MSGERAKRYIDLANQASERVVQRLAMIEDYYGAMTGDPDVLTWDEIAEEMQEYGHNVPDPNCNSPVCQKARMMLANALQGAFAGGQNA